jgi:hypothetical protein
MVTDFLAVEPEPYLRKLAARPARRLAEARRVLRANGTLRFLEHTVAAIPALRVVQRVADAAVWPRLAGGCHTATDLAAQGRARRGRPDAGRWTARGGPDVAAPLRVGAGAAPMCLHRLR